MTARYSARSLTRGAIVASAYAALTLLVSLFGLGFGPIQIRVSEALTILPVFSAGAIPVLGVGCALANLIGLLLGNPLGWLDVFCGTFATLVAACLTYLLRNVRWHGLPVLSTLPPVLVNAVVVGLELTFVFHDGWQPAMFGYYALTVGAGQLIACVGGGLAVFAALKKSKLVK